MKKLQFCLVFFSLLVLVLSTAAQVTNGQFAGTITDPSGAAIANAKVTATNPATNLSVTGTTNATGLYSLKELPPGSYKITAEAPPKMPRFAPTAASNRPAIPDCTSVWDLPLGLSQL